MNKPAAFIDRDGTLVEEVNFLSRIEDLRVFPFAAEALRLLSDAGFYIVVVTNQSGIGRGLYTEADMHAIHLEMQRQLGGLKKVVDILGDYWINLTKIQSVPIVGKPNEYTFLVDLEWSNYEDYDTAITKVLKKTFNLSILGEYSKGKFVNAKLSNEINMYK